jgi:hypothetical protein
MIVCGLIALSIQSTALAVPVRLKSQCASVEVITKEIAHLSGIEIRTQADAGKEVMFISEAELPASQWIERLRATTLCRLEFIGGICYLTPDLKTRHMREEKDHKRLIEAYRRYVDSKQNDSKVLSDDEIATLGQRLAKALPFTTDQSYMAFQQVQRAALAAIPEWKLLPYINLDEAAEFKWGEHVAYSTSPNKLQRSLGKNSEQMLETMKEVISAEVHKRQIFAAQGVADNNPLPKSEGHKLVVSFENGPYPRFMLADAEGKIGYQLFSGIFPKYQATVLKIPHVQPPTKVMYRDVTREWLKLWKSNSFRPTLFEVSKVLRETLKDIRIDLTDLGVNEALTEYARELGRPVVGIIPDSFYYSLIAGEINPDGHEVAPIANFVETSAEIGVADHADWVELTPQNWKSCHEARSDREALHSFVIRLLNGTGFSLADAANYATKMPPSFYGSLFQMVAAAVSPDASWLYRKNNVQWMNFFGTLSPEQLSRLEGGGSLGRDGLSAEQLAFLYRYLPNNQAQLQRLPNSPEAAKHLDRLNELSECELTEILPNDPFQLRLQEDPAAWTFEAHMPLSFSSWGWGDPDDLDLGLLGNWGWRLNQESRPKIPFTTYGKKQTYRLIFDLDGGAWCTTLVDRQVSGTFKGLNVSDLPDELKGRLERAFQAQAIPPQ